MDCANFAPSLQQLIVRWRSQTAVHAVLMLPQLLPVQIGRCNAGGQKLTFRVGHSRHVHVPYFADAGAHTASRRFETVAVIFHLGPRVLNGPYRAILCVDGCMCYSSDENQPAADIAETDLELIERGAYICCDLSRCNPGAFRGDLSVDCPIQNACGAVTPDG